jgi:hypothetical protein
MGWRTGSQRLREMARNNLAKAGRDDFARHANSLGGGGQSASSGGGASRPVLRCRRKLSIFNA